MTALAASRVKPHKSVNETWKSPRLQRPEEGIVVATGAPRQPGCPPWVVLGVKALEAPGVRAA